MEILKQSGLPRLRMGGVGAASANNFPSTEDSEKSLVGIIMAKYCLVK